MPARLLRVALTGGIATGKSLCLRRFSELGVPTIDADVLARSAVAPGSPGLDAVVRRFGATVLRADGSLDRTTLARIVFSDEGARADLERIIHPEVFLAMERWIGRQAADADRPDHPGFLVADVPLLYETGHEHDFDRVVVAACTAQQQLSRLMTRDGLTRDDAMRRIGAQMPIEEKRQRADVVIDTSGSQSDTLTAVDAVWRQLRR